jgi:hypothetical protein
VFFFSKLLASPLIFFLIFCLSSTTQSVLLVAWIIESKLSRWLKNLALEWWFCLFGFCKGVAIIWWIVCLALVYKYFPSFLLCKIHPRLLSFLATIFLSVLLKSLWVNWCIVCCWLVITFISLSHDDDWEYYVDQQGFVAMMSCFQVATQMKFSLWWVVILPPLWIWIREFHLLLSSFKNGKLHLPYFIPIDWYQW